MAKIDKKADAEEDTRSLKEKIVQELKEWGMTLGVFIPLFLIFSGLVYEQRVIPSESMVPNLQVGDRVAVAKWPYGYGQHSLPFSIGRYLPLGEGRIFAKTPKRGDVVVFEHTHTPRVMIKRVIGLPGDTIQIVGEQLVLNGEPVPSELVRRVSYTPHGRSQKVSAREIRETLGDVTYLTNQFEKGYPLDDTGLFKVPEGHLFMMGDNRDNSLDSRDTSGHCAPVNGVIDRAGCDLRVPAKQASIGFVPMDHLIGRGDTVILSFYRCKLDDGAECKKRVWKPL